MNGERGAVVRGAAWILLASTLWSTAAAAIRMLPEVSPLGVSAGRSLIAAACFFALLRGRVRPPRGSGRPVLLGAVAYAMLVTSFVVANRLTTAANAILMQYTAPLWIALFGWAFLHERPSRAEMFALFLGGGGVAWCMYPGLSLFAQSGGVSRGLVGDAVALLSGISFAAMTLVFRLFGRSSPAAGAPANASLLMLFHGNLIAGIFGCAVLLGQGGGAAFGVFSLAAVAIFLAMGVLQLAGGYWCYQRGLRLVPALTASLLCLVDPVLTPVWVALLAGEPPAAEAIVGGALVLVAVLIVLAAQWRRGRSAGR